jgi:cobalt-zinc-cadmium efflux system protein
MHKPAAPHSSGHTHGALTIAPDADRRRLLAALALIVCFMAAEVVVGVTAHSLALLGDAGHMLTDAGAIVLSIVALQLAARPPAAGLTYGLKRTEILSALANGATLFLFAGLVVVEGAQRLASPPDVNPGPVIAVALLGCAVNIAAGWQLAGAERRSLNIEGSYRHIVTDLYAFGATAIAGIVIAITGWSRADAVASLVIAALMLQAGIRLLADAGRVLLEAAPRGTDVEQIGGALAAHPHVANVHDLHVWEVTSDFPALSAHVIVHSGDDCHAIRLELEALLRERFGIGHTTLQVDHDRSGRLMHPQPIGRKEPPAGDPLRTG